MLGTGQQEVYIKINREKVMEYDTSELDNLISMYIDNIYNIQKSIGHKEQDKLKQHNVELVEFCLIPHLPKLTLSIVIKILKKDSSDIIIKVLAAGEIDGILTQHGINIIEDIEYEAKQNRTFRELLKYVWQGDISDDIYQRVQKVSRS